LNRLNSENLKHDVSRDKQIEMPERAAVVGEE
jgi:hypothetical protein